MTPAIDLLRRLGIEHEVAQYDHDPNHPSFGQEAADALGVEPDQTLRSGEPADEILAMVEELSVDIVVMGANLRRPEGRPFLGHTVERILRECDATVVLVLMPFDL